jgi:hypothetical protein
VNYLLCGASAGITALIIVYTLDLVKTILAVRVEKGKSPSIFKTLVNLYK